MQIKDLFVRNISRPINGVVKADQLDEDSVWQELDEFVITSELNQHLRKFFSVYLSAVTDSKDIDPSSENGVWISGFFGSGKSHLLKILSYLLCNGSHSHHGHTKKAVEFFEGKIPDAMFFAEIKQAVASETDVILFNIDSKADGKAGRDTILQVFLKVFNTMLGYSGDYPHVANMERYLDSKGKLAEFQAAFKKHKGKEWLAERDAFFFNRDETVKSLMETLNISEEAARKWDDGAEQTFSVTVENFCKWVKEYLDSKGPKHRIIFLVDEVGQFIGEDSQLMLNLQTITENLGTICKGRAWVVVTSQEDIDAVLGTMKQSKVNDFSKITGRFHTRLSLSGANVDEVIQARLLDKRPEVREGLINLYKAKGDILKGQLILNDCGMTFAKFRDSEEFVKDYPFAPHQFQLVQKVFEAIRKVGATGTSLSKGERSMLDAFQSAAKIAATKEVGVLVPLYDFYPAIESFLDTAVKKTISTAAKSPHLQPFDHKLLSVLFMIRYVTEIKGNVDNLVTLCLEKIDDDRLALRKQIDDSLSRLEGESLVSHNGDTYLFLTNEEQDINKLIRNIEILNGEESRALSEIVFSTVFKALSKHRYSVNKIDFDFNRRCDHFPQGQQKDGALLVSVITPLADDYSFYDKGKGILESSADGGHVLFKLGNEDSLVKELSIYLKTEKYLKRSTEGTSETTVRIRQNLAEDNRQRLKKLAEKMADLAVNAECFVAGQTFKTKAVLPVGCLEEALEYLIQNTFSKMSYLKKPVPEPLKELQATLRSNDVAKEKVLFDAGEHNQEAMDDLRNYLELSSNKIQVILYDLLEKRYAIRPYGWADEQVLVLLARLLVMGEINLVIDGGIIPIDKAEEALTNSAKRRKLIIRKRETADPKQVQFARGLGKDLFAEMGPDGEEKLAAFLLNHLKDWQISLNSYKQLADTGDYPGKSEIADGLTLIAPLLADKETRKFIERFITLEKSLLELSDEFADLKNFYEHQKPSWDKLRKSHAAFLLNRVELEKDSQAGPALTRMKEILTAPSPYGIIKEADALITKVEMVNAKLLDDQRASAIAKINAQIATIEKDVVKAGGDVTLKPSCIGPLRLLLAQVEKEQSLAHITQAESNAIKDFDAAISRIEDFQNKLAQQQKAKEEEAGKPPTPPVSPVKKQRIIKPSELVKASYLETDSDVDGFIDSLRLELHKAIANNERIQIR